MDQIGLTMDSKGLKVVFCTKNTFFCENFVCKTYAFRGNNFEGSQLGGSPTFNFALSVDKKT